MKRTSFAYLMIALLGFLLMALTGCSGPRVAISPGFNPSPEEGIVYIVPFANSLVPAQFSEAVFNDFVDELNNRRTGTNVKWYYIIKDDLKDLDAPWLARQVFITGELWSYIEHAGCCSTELRTSARLRIFEAGQTAPSAEVNLPIEAFFEHDRSTLATEREKLAKRLAVQMAETVTKIFANRKTDLSP